jgi:hypothetical protein
MIVEMLIGTLPWKGMEKESIGAIKMNYTNPNLIKDLPRELLTFYNHLLTLEFSSKPNYSLVKACFVQMFQSTGVSDEVQFDWSNTGTVSLEDISEPSTKDVQMNIDCNLNSQGGKYQAEPLHLVFNN